MNNIPTAEDFLNSQGLPQEKLQNLPWFDYGNILTWLEEYSKIQATYHLQAQQEAILEKVRANHIECWGQRTGDIEIDKDSIINAYPLNLIK